MTSCVPLAVFVGVLIGGILRVVFQLLPVGGVHVPYIVHLQPQSAH